MSEPGRVARDRPLVWREISTRQEDTMGMWQRFKLIFASKANKALYRAEDPRETLDYSYEKQL